jgi:hypothetical protein
MKISTALIAALSLFLFSISPTQAYIMFQDNSKGSTLVLSEAVNEAHDVNEVYMMVSNVGVLATNLETGTSYNFFPSNTSNRYVYSAGLWFGAYYDVDGDSVPDKVFTEAIDPTGAGDSEFREGRGDQDPDDPLTRVFDSTEPEDLADWPPQFSDPVSGEPIVYSDQDLVTTYTTKDASPIYGEYQIPLEVDQRSMVVISPDSINQVIYFVSDVINWGDKILEDAWIGFLSDMDIGDSFGDDHVSVILEQIIPQGDTVTHDMGYAWDSDFSEGGFVGDPGFVGVTLLLSPGNPNDGVDNDGDGLVDESPWNGIDDDMDGLTDEWDEVDEIGLVNFSKICNPSVPCELNDPQSDSTGYDMLSCNTPGSSISCLESTTLADVRFMISSGPFDWLPGQKQRIALAFVFANSVGSPDSLVFVGDPPRPDPNDPAMGEFVRIAEKARDFFPTMYIPTRIGSEPKEDFKTNLPRALVLSQNYPNPFNPSTTIAFDLPGTASIRQHISLTIYDIRGRLIKKLVDEKKEAGYYSVNWDGRDRIGHRVSSGIYLYRMQIDRNLVSTKKMVLLK